MSVDLTHPAEQLATLVAGVTDQQLDDPTPCQEMPVRTLLAHVLGLAQAFADAAAKVTGPGTDTPPDPSATALPDDWRTEIPVRLRGLVDAWADADAWQGETTAGGITMPAEDMGFVVNNELVLHGWDLAVATDQPYEVAEPNLDASWVMVFNTPDNPDARAGLFGPRLPVSDGAPLMDRVLAGAGRDPYWSAAG